MSSVTELPNLRVRDTPLAATACPPHSLLRVLLVVDHFYPYVGGNETLYWNVARALVRAGHKVTVLTRQDGGTAKRETLDGVEVRRVWTPETMQRFFFVLLVLPSLWRHARMVDVVHAVVYASALPAWLVAMLFRKPFVLTVHEAFGGKWRTLVDIHRFGAWVLRYFEWLLLHLPLTNYNCGTQFTSRRIQEVGGVSAKRISVVPYAIDYEFWDSAKHKARDLRQQLDLPTDTFLYLYFGRPGASKGVEYLVRAAAVVREAVPNSRLVLLLGRHPAARYQRIREMIQEDDLGHHAIVLESVPHAELPSYLLAANCVVVPSISEGFGYSALEAATLGCRVISTLGHAVEEVLAGDAEFVPTCDAAALARKIIEASHRNSKPPRCSKRYDVATHTRGLEELYESVIDRPGYRQ